MKLLKSKYSTMALFAGALLLHGCSSYEPVPVSECTDVIKHAKKILGNMAPKHSEMMADCKKATDIGRGCIMAAETKVQISQCL